MDHEDRELFEERWNRLRQHLEEVKGDRTQPLFRFSLASFLVVTAVTGVTIGCVVRLCGSDGVALLALVAIIILYFVTIIGGEASGHVSCRV
jgi:Flp pilus assembly protein TadB